MFRKKKWRQQVLASHQHPKTGIFDFENISLYFKNNGHDRYFQIISDRTASDLDFEEIFRFLDRTSSSIGQQVLYSFLRTIPEDTSRAKMLQKQIEMLASDEKRKNLIVLELSRLNNPRACFIQSLFTKEHIQRPGWFIIVPILSAVAATLTVGVFFHAPLLLPLIGVIVINFIFHYWNKRNLMTYANSIPQLRTLSLVTRQILKSDAFQQNREKIDQSNRILERISRQSILLNWGSQTTDEYRQISDSFLELIKASFLLEIIFTFSILKNLENKRKELKTVFESIGMLDVSVSILSLRATNPGLSIPTIQETGTHLHAKNMFHPLIEQPVSNSIRLDEKTSALITGSNMSGKTTFIRTIGINAILAQTLNVAFADSFSLPRLKVHSAIRIADDLLEDTSYYLEEVNAIKDIIREGELEHLNLILLDELFKGTNTVERVASGKAVLSYLSRHGNIVFASTHDIELADLLESSFEFYHFTEQVKDDNLLFDYKIKTGKLTETNAIQVLEINHYPREITEEAKSLASYLSQKEQG